MKNTEAFDFEGQYGTAYNEFVQRVIPAYNPFFQLTLALLQTRLAAAAQMLVVGCGSGKEITTFGPSCPGWHFTAVDPSAQMIEVAAAAVITAGVADRVVFHQGYTHELPAAKVFDVATLINVMHLLPDNGAKQDLVCAIAQRLRCGGTLILFDLHGDPSLPAFGRLLEAWKKFMVLQDFSTEERAVFMQRLDKGIDYIPEERVLDICRFAGLEFEERYFSGLLYGGWVFTKR